MFFPPRQLRLVCGKQRPSLLQRLALLLQLLVREGACFVLGMVPCTAQVRRQAVLGRHGDTRDARRKPFIPDVEQGADGVGRATAEVLTHALDNRFEAPGQQRVGRLDHLFQLSTARPAPPG
jgi:hypothetical protein